METWDDLFERATVSRSRPTSGSVVGSDSGAAGDQRATSDSQVTSGSEAGSDPDATGNSDTADGETSDCVENVRETRREVRRE